MKNIESQLLLRASRSFDEANFLSVAPRSGVMAIKSAKRKYSIQIPNDIASSVAEMWEPSTFYTTQLYMRRGMFFTMVY